MKTSSLITNWAKYMNRYFINEVTQISHKHIKILSITSHQETTIKYDYLFIIANIKKQK